MHGVDLVNLAIFCLVRLKAYIDKARAYINNWNPNVRPYSRSQVTRAEQHIGLWQKVASSTLNEAYRPVNLSKRADCWRESYPSGVNDQDTAYMIEINEAGFKLEL